MKYLSRRKLKAKQNVELKVSFSSFPFFHIEKNQDKAIIKKKIIFT